MWPYQPTKSIWCFYKNAMIWMYSGHTYSKVVSNFRIKIGHNIRVKLFSFKYFCVTG